MKSFDSRDLVQRIHASTHLSPAEKRKMLASFGDTFGTNLRKGSIPWSTERLPVASELILERVKNSKTRRATSNKKKKQLVLEQLMMENHFLSLIATLMEQENEGL